MLRRGVTGRTCMVAPTNFSLSTSLRWATVTAVPFPALSPTMEQGSITEWAKKVGDELTSGDMWGKVETDKATVDFKNQSDEGFVAKLLVPAGSAVHKVGDIIALVVDEKADIDSDDVKNWKPDTEDAPPADTPAAATPAAASKAAAAPAAAAKSEGGRVFASPLARTLAKEIGIDLSQVKGTGGTVGRVTKDDLKNYKPAAAGASKAAPAAAAPAPATASPVATQAQAAVAAAYEDLPITGMRRTIASRLTSAKNGEIPHYYETVDCAVDNMTQLIKHLNNKGDGKYKVTVNDFLIKAIARANLIVPACNTHWHGDVLRQYKSVDVSVAVATPTGLITPIIKDAQNKGLVAISTEVKALAKKAKEGTLAPSEYQGGTVTISNLGGMGINKFTAIINPPQAFILAVGNIQPRPEIITNAEGEFEATGKIEKVMTFTASFDHRVIDGAVGAEWFKHFKDTIENPLSLLL